MVARPEKALDEKIETGRHIRRKDDTAGIGRAKQRAQLLARFEDEIFRAVGRAIGAAADVAAAGGHILRNGLRHAVRLWKGCTAIVKIDWLHRYPSTYRYIHSSSCLFENQMDGTEK